jgi:hypothetical protein
VQKLSPAADATGIALPDHLARYSPLNTDQWQLLEASLAIEDRVMARPQLEATLRPVHSDAIGQCTALPGQCFFFQRHLFCITTATVDVSTGGDIRVAISARSIWQQPI